MNDSRHRKQQAIETVIQSLTQPAAPPYRGRHDAPQKTWWRRPRLSPPKSAPGARIGRSVVRPAGRARVGRPTAGRVTSRMMRRSPTGQSSSARAGLCDTNARPNDGHLVAIATPGPATVGITAAAMTCLAEGASAGPLHQVDHGRVHRDEPANNPRHCVSV